MTRLVTSAAAVLALATLCLAQENVKPTNLGKGAEFKGKKIEYHKVFEDKPTEMSVWEFEPAKKENQPEMRFRIVDFRNLLNETTNERIVFVSLRIGPENRPYWQGIVTKGSHSKSQ